MRRTPAAGCALALFTATAAAQSPTSPTFDVVSIKPNPDKTIAGSGLAAPLPGGRLMARGATLRTLVGIAYPGLDIVGGPAWADSARFDVTATSSGNPAPSDMSVMFRRVLEQRFALKAHIEPREMAVYKLTLARGDRRLGPKLTPSDAQCAAEARVYVPALVAAATPPCGDFRMSARSLTARGMTMGGLGQRLRGRVARPVVDQTGLEGAFDLQIDWSSDIGLSAPIPGSAGAADTSPDGVSLFTALQEQLGLRLEPGRAAVDVLVIDRAQPPTEN